MLKGKSQPPNKGGIIIRDCLITPKLFQEKKNNKKMNRICRQSALLAVQIVTCAFEKPDFSILACSSQNVVPFLWGKSHRHTHIKNNNNMDIK